MNIFGEGHETMMFKSAIVFVYSFVMSQQCMACVYIAVH